MDYSELLSKYIKDSGQTLSVICQRLQQKGIAVDRSYLSKLKTGAKPPASQELSRAIAEITGGDPEALVLAGYFEKAPDELKSSIEELNNVVYDTLDLILMKATSSQMFELLVNIRRENIDNPYVQGLLNNIGSNDNENIDYEDRLSILAIYAKETFNLRDKLKLLVVVNLFYMKLVFDSSGSQHSTQKEDSSNARSSSKVIANFASFNDKKEILSDDEAEFLQDCLIAYRKQQQKARNNA